MKKKAVILDTHPGIGTSGPDVDDGLAIALGLLRPTCNLLGSPSRIERLLAGSMLATIPIVVLFFVLQKYYVQSVTSTGIKG